MQKHCIFGAVLTFFSFGNLFLKLKTLAPQNGLYLSRLHPVIVGHGLCETPQESMLFKAGKRSVRGAGHSAEVVKNARQGPLLVPARRADETVLELGESRPGCWRSNKKGCLKPPSTLSRARVWVSNISSTCQMFPTHKSFR